MKIGDRHYRTIWAEDGVVRIIDQTLLPHELRIVPLETLEEAAHAISTMQVRGAPLIGAAAAYGLALAMAEDPSDTGLERALQVLLATRPTAVNLRWALDRCRAVLADIPPQERAAASLREAGAVADEDVERNRTLGAVAADLLTRIAADRDHPVTSTAPLHVLTHCNAGWLATVDHGTATAGIYHAHDQGLPLHVWVDETRPRGQGARLTAWELGQHGVPHTVIADSAAAHLLATARVDVVIVGTDRTAANGDVANKIGTYPLALAAHDNRVPFHVAAPGPSIDFGARSGADIPIEERSGEELTWVSGLARDGSPAQVRVTPETSAAANPAFDITPARLVTGIITERGIAQASESALARMYPEEAGAASNGPGSQPHQGD